MCPHKILYSIIAYGQTLFSIDLTAASQVHLLEPGWNPMLERQALDRVHRIGQKRNVLTIRYIVTGATSIEEVIPIFQGILATTNNFGKCSTSDADRSGN